MENVRQFGWLDMLQLLPALLELLESFHDGLRHATVSFLRSADDRELLTGGDSLVTVVIVEADTQQTRR